MRARALIPSLAELHGERDQDRSFQPTFSRAPTGRRSRVAPSEPRRYLLGMPPFGPPPPPLEGTRSGAGQEARPRATESRAILSLVLGALSLVTCGMTGIPAVAVGLTARGAIARSRGTLGGAGIAAAGIATGLADCDGRLPASRAPSPA